ncbi:MAG: zinc ribbon domain-containing protein [Anaerolineae bacterium]|nr:zinc ribbon domain-containing protein [Anaerolineae bacterium]
MRNWRRCGVLVAVVCGLLLGLSGQAGAGAQAQEPVPLDTLTISLWPEYDREGVLVIYRGTVAADTPLPFTVRFAVPKTMANLGGTAGVDAQGEFHYYRPSVRDLGTALEVSYTTAYPTFQFEYYDGALQVEGDQRTYTFTYPGAYAVGALVLEAQEPAGAQDFATEPEGVQAQDPLGSGLQVRRWVVGPAEAGESLTFRIRYRKTDPRLSAEILGLPTPGTSPYEDVSQAGRSQAAQPSGLVTAALAVLAMGGVLAAVYFGWLRPRLAAPDPPPRPRRRPKKRRRARATVPPASQAAQDAPARFCHRCGTALGPEDRFCPQCGARRKGV